MQRFATICSTLALHPGRHASRAIRTWKKVTMASAPVLDGFELFESASRQALLRDLTQIAGAQDNARINGGARVDQRESAVV